MAEMPSAPRLLIVRLSAIGDVIHGLPVLNALRDAWPQAFIAWACERSGAQLLRGHRSLDELVELPRGWLKSPGEVWRLRRRLRALSPDISVDLQGLTKSALVAWWSGARTRLGFAGEDGRELSWLLNNRRKHPTAIHVVDRNLQLLDLVGIKAESARFDVPLLPEVTARVESLLRDRDLDKRFAVINPGAGWPSKRWPRPRYAEVASHLRSRHGLAVLVVWAGDMERAWAEEIVAVAGGAAVLAPATDLTELAALLNRAALCIGSDTGPLHLAAAQGVPSVGLYGPMPAARNGLYGPRCISLQEMQVAGSSRERRRASTEAMEAISVDQVCAACDRLLAETQTPRKDPAC